MVKHVEEVLSPQCPACCAALPGISQACPWISFLLRTTCREGACPAHSRRIFMSTPSPSSSSPSIFPPAWMSWWDRYFAPGDLRRRQQAPPPPPAAPTSHDGAPHTTTPALRPSVTAAFTRIDPSHRARRQNALFFGGLAFSLLSVAVTRRTILRKRSAAYPSTFTPSHMHIEPPPGPLQQMSKVEGTVMAIEALGLATLNVCAFFMAGVGGAMMWFDIAELEDLRGKVREGVGSGGEVDEETEKAVEGWIAGAFGHEQDKAVGNESGFGSEALRQGVRGELEKMREEKKLERGDR